ncbi:MAG TPA: acyltransferase [Acidobacteriaceae bacterium]|nr:acyltransferase [Acidobacteriaceae bacterium]
MSVGRRLEGIDVLRGISIVAVVLHHTNLHMAGRPVEQMLPTQLGRILFWNGANGVSIFFAISGFLITTMALRRWNTLGAVRPAAFYRLRVARIAPLLLTLLLALAVLDLSGLHGYTINPGVASLPRSLLAALTFHVNWLEAHHGYLPPNWDVLWSLCIEEVFYLGFPLFCFVTRGRWPLYGLWIVFVILGPFSRTVFSHIQLWRDYNYLSGMDGIALGCLAAVVAVRVRIPPRWLAPIRIAGAALMLLIVTARPWVRALHLYATGLDVTVLTLGTCLVMIALAQRNHSGSRLTAPLRWFGRNSYEVYLTHMFVVIEGIHIFDRARLGVALATPWYLLLLVAAGFLGAAVARFYSEPLNRRLRESVRVVT